MRFLECQSPSVGHIYISFRRSQFLRDDPHNLGIVRFENRSVRNSKRRLDCHRRILCAFNILY